MVRVERDGFLHVFNFMQKRGHAIMASRRESCAVAFGRSPAQLLERACSRIAAPRSR